MLPLKRTLGLTTLLIVVTALMISPVVSAATPGQVSPSSSGSNLNLSQSLAMAKNATLDPSNFPPANFTNLPASPPPPVPNESPIVLKLTQYGVVNIPYGNWETVIMNYTGYTAGTAYDYFQTVTINKAMVYIGVNPEAGAWTQFVNLSQYMSFFDHKNNITITGPHLGLGRNFQGIQYNNISLMFYPVMKGKLAPSEPNIVEPLFKFHGIPYGKNVSTSINVPDNASAVVLQTIVIGNEFWYSLNPSYAAVTFSVGSHEVATHLVYPWINSGGIDLFTWRPIYPVYMLNHKWDNMNLTGALGLLEKNNTLSISSPAGGEPSYSVTANLLIYTSKNVTSAAQTSYYYNQSPLKTVTQENTSVVNINGNYYTQYSQSRSIDYAYSSKVTTTTGSYSVNSRTSEYFSNNQTLTPVWQNITQTENTQTSTVTHYHELGKIGTVVTHKTLVYPLAMQLMESLTYLYNQGNLYYFNYTSLFLNVTQGYYESNAMHSDVNGHTSMDLSVTNNLIYGTNGEFSSVLEISPYFAIILNITSSYHFTQKQYTSFNLHRSGNSLYGQFYLHKLSGIEKNSTSYYVQETVLTNTVNERTFGNMGDHSFPH